MRPKLVRPTSWGPSQSLVSAIVFCSGIYWTPIAFGSLNVRAFEVLTILWVLMFGITGKVRITGTAFGIVGLIISMLISLIAQGPELEGLLIVLRLLVALAIVITITSAIGANKETLYRICIWWYIGGFIVVFFGVLGWLIAVFGGNIVFGLVYVSTSGFRAQSVLPDPNRFGNFAAIIFIAGAVWAVFSGRRSPILIIAVLISLLGVLLSQSRGALLALVPGTVIVGLLGILTNRNTMGHTIGVFLRILFLVAGIGIVLYSVTLGPPEALTRLPSQVLKDDYVENPRISYALQGVEVGFSTVKSAVVGTGGYGLIEMGTGRVTPHNTYLSVFVMQGLIGLGCFIMILMGIGIGMTRKIFLRGADELSRVRLALLGTLMVGAAHSFTINLYTTGYFWIMIGLCTASLSVIRPHRGQVRV